MYRNKTAELVNQWAVFEATHPEADIEDFCSYYLISRRQKDDTQKLFDGVMPPGPHIVINKLIGRIAKLFMIYINMALEDIRIHHFEEFNLLNAIAHLKEPKKTEVIYHTINELSTGLNLLAGLKKQGYIIEQDDPDDKRSKRLRLTPKGEKILKACRERLSKVPEMIFMDMPSEDIELCVQLLKNIDIKFSALWQQHKGRPFVQVYEAMTGKKIDSDSRLDENRKKTLK
jgi:DNA-binding MarR family transcriptional regulator